MPRGLSWIGLRTSERERLAARPWPAGPAAVLRTRLLERAIEQDRLVTLAQQVLSGDPGARASVRRALMAALPAEPDQIAAGILQAAAGEGGPRARTGELAEDEAALVAAAVLSATTPGEALAFTVPALGVVGDRRALRLLVARGDGGPVGGLPVVEPGPALRVPVGLVIPEVVPADRIRWPEEEQRVFPDVVFQGAGRCAELLAGLLATASRAHPPYAISSLSPDDACVGQLVELTGTGFGRVSGRVAFGGIRGGSSFVVPESWSDTRIRARVPADATGGPVGLEVRLGETPACGRIVPIWLSGTDVVFHGGQPVVDSIAFDTDRDGQIDVFAPVTVRWVSRPPDRAGAPGTARLEIRLDGGPVVATMDGLPASGSTSLDLSSVATVRTLVARITVRTGCDIAFGEARARSAHRSDLRVEGIELTQGAQASAGVTPVALVADRDVAVRVYARARTEFDWGYGPGRFPVLARIDHAGGTESRSTFVEPVTDPSDPLGSITFTLAAAHVRAKETVSVRAEVRPDPARIPDRGRPVDASASVPVDAAPAPRRMILLRIAHPAVGLPAPALADIATMIAASRARLPLGRAQWQLVQVAPLLGFDVPTGLDLDEPVPTGNTDLDNAATARIRANWDRLHAWVHAARSIVGAGPGDLTVGVVPNRPQYLLNGIGGSGSLIGRIGFVGTFAHEVGHAVGVDHTQGVNPIEAPIATDQPPKLDHPGWDANRNRPVPAGMPDLMTYDTPPATLGWAPLGGWTFQDRWPTRVLWTRLKGLL